jgi:glutamate-1-semialdehyde 2,1-aminomutase
VIGGGMPVGAFGGRAELMAELSPQGSVYQAGTLSGNPVAMAAGLATLNVLDQEDGWARLEEMGAQLAAEVNAVLETTSANAALARIGSIFWLACGSRELPRSASGLAAGAADAYAGIFRSLLGQGIALAPSAFEVGFLSLLHSVRDIDRLAAGLQRALAER